MDPRTAALYKKYGVSPETHDLDAVNGRFVPKAQPAAKPQMQPMNPVGSFLHSAAEGVVPAITSGIAAVPGMAGGTVLAGPVGGLVGGVGLGVAGGIGGDILQRKIAREFAPDFMEDWEAQEAANAAANPKSALAGRLVSGLAGNKLQLGRNVSALRSLFQPGALPGAAKQALTQAGVNAGIGAGMQGVEDVLSDRGLEADRLGMAAAANLALGDVRRPLARVTSGLANKIAPDSRFTAEANKFAAGVEPEALALRDAFAANRGDSRPMPLPKAAKPNPADAPVGESQATVIQQLLDAANNESSRKAVLITPQTVIKGIQRKLFNGLVKVPTKFGNVFVNPAKLPPGSLADVDKLEQFPAELLGMSQNAKPPGGDAVVTGEQNGVETTSEVVRSDDPASVAAAANAAKAASPGADVTVKDPAEVVAERNLQTETDAAFRAAEESRKRAEDFAKAKQEEALANVPPVKERPLKGKLWDFVETLPNRKQLTEETRPVVDENATTPKPDDAALTAPLSEAEQVQEDFDLGRRHQPDAEAPSKQSNITKGWFNFWKGTGLRKYLSSTETGEVKMPDGGNARGAQDISERATTIDPARATRDTQPHELFHQFIADVQANGTSGEKRFIANALKAFNNDEEALTQAVGKSLVGRFDKDPGMLSDVVNFVRYKLGRANDKTAARLGAAMMDRGRGSAEMKGLAGVKEGLKFQGAGEAPIFSTEFEKELKANPSRPFKIQVAKDGRMNARDVIAALEKQNPAELEMLKASGLVEYLNKTVRPTAGELSNWLDANGPKLEIKELDATPKVSEAELALGQLKHEWYDNLTNSQQVDVDYYLRRSPADRKILDEAHLKDLGGDTTYIENLHKLAKLYDVTEAEFKSNQSNDSATARYPMVNPRELADMPGAVDILVRVPTKELPEGKLPEDVIVDEASRNQYVPIYPASDSHYPQSGDNLLTHVRAYEHTLPDGRRVLRAFEVQSDWAQQRGRQEKEYTFAQDEKDGTWTAKRKDGSKVGGFSTEESARQYISEEIATASHPLHPHVNRIGLKAFIEIARKRGLDGVVLDDAETAMLTEGHDKPRTSSIKPADILDLFDTESDIARAYGEDWASGKYVKFGDTPYRVDRPEVMRFFNGGEGNSNNIEVAQALEPYWQDPSMPTTNQRQYIPQERGMRHNYDGDLQRGARDLSGTEGVPVELGEHKNVGAIQKITEFGLNSDEVFDGPAKTKLLGELNQKFPQPDHEYRFYSDNDGDRVEIWKQNTRPDLIFRNPDGTPKTKSTGWFFPIDAPVARRNKGEPFSMTGRKYQADEPEALRKPFKPGAAFTASPFDQLRSSNDPDYKAIGNAGTTAMHQKRELSAKWTTPVIEAVSKLSKQEQAQMRQYLIDAFNNRDETPVEGSAALQNAVQAFRDNYANIREYANERGLQVHNRGGDGRPGRLDPVGMPHVIDPEIHRIMREEVDSPRWRELAQEFVDYNTDLIAGREKNKLKPEEIASILDAKIKYFSGGVRARTPPLGNDAASKAMRAAALTKLPDSWIDKDIARLWSRYTDKAAADIAQWNNFERDPRMRALTGFNAGAKDDATVNPISGHPTVRAAFEAFNPTLRQFSRAGKFANSLAGTANNLLTANPVTRGVDLLTTIPRALTFTGPHKIPEVVTRAAIAAGRAYKAAKANGNIRPGTQYLTNMSGTADELYNWVRAANAGWSTITGSEAAEKASRFTAQMLGRGVVDSMAGPALNGDRNSQTFFKKLGNDWQELLDSPEGRDTLASRVAGHVQGFYDGSNTPSWAETTAAKPWVRLMRWTLEQTNNFKKFQLEPAKEGNFGPMLSYLAALGAGGAGIAAYREWANGQKSYIPTWKEIKNAPDKSRQIQATAHKLAALADGVGAFGIYATIANTITAGSRGMPIQEPGIPAVNQMWEAGKHIQAALGAISDGADIWPVMSEAFKNIARSTVSAYRVLDNQMEPESKAARKDAKRDFKVYEDLRGKPRRTFAPITGYGSLDEKRFDETQDLGEAADIAFDARMEAEDWEAKKRSLRSMGGGRVGPLSRDRKEFRDYNDWIEDTQGVDAAIEREDFLRDDERLRERKRRLVR